MQYKIVYDKPGRLRLRMGQEAFSDKQGYGIEALLLSSSGALSVETNCVNGGILVCYEPGCRDRILAAVDALDRKNLPIPSQQDMKRIKEPDNGFSSSLVVALCRHCITKLLVPAPLRIIYRVQQALSMRGSYIKHRVR